MKHDLKKKEKYHLVTRKNNQINKSYSEQLCNGTTFFLQSTYVYIQSVEHGDISGAVEVV